MNKLVPKLRFNEFKGSWKKGTIGDYYENLRTGMTPSRTKPDYFKGTIPWITSGELNYGYIEKTTEYITKEAVDNTNLKIYPPNTLFIAITGLEAPGTRGKCAMNKMPAATNQSCMAFEAIPNVNTLFLFQWYIKYGIWLYYSFAQGTKQQSFNNKLVKTFAFNIPSFPEQQKIASFLSAIDEKIRQLTRRKELLEQYKKGVMQQLFSGKLRFKDEQGKVYPKWEEKRLGDVCDVRDGTHDTPKYCNEGFPLITSKNLTKNGKLDYENISLISKQDYEEINKRSGVSTGDILFGMIGTIGNPVIIENTGFAIKNVALLKELVELKNIYLIHYLKSSFILKQFSQFNAGGIQKFISLGLIRNLTIQTPQVDEQTKIAEFLSKIDTKIESVSAQIEGTQRYKKGLLQKMFV